MLKLLELATKLVTKYKDEITIIVEGFSERIVIEYFYLTGGEFDTYKSIVVTEFEDKFRVQLDSEKITKVVTEDEINNIIIGFRKESKQAKLTEAEIKLISEKYTKGTKIRILEVYNSKSILTTSIEENSIGYVDNVDNKGIIHITLESGNTTELYINVDEFKILEE